MQATLLVASIQALLRRTLAQVPPDLCTNNLSSTYMVIDKYSAGSC